MLILICFWVLEGLETEAEKGGGLGQSEKAREGRNLGDCGSVGPVESWNGGGYPKKEDMQTDCFGPPSSKETQTLEAFSATPECVTDLPRRRSRWVPRAKGGGELLVKTIALARSFVDAVRSSTWRCALAGLLRGARSSRSNDLPGDGHELQRQASLRGSL